MKKDKVIKVLSFLYWGKVEHRIKVTRIGRGWNVRLYTNEELSQEVRVYDRSRIGIAAREMLRMEDKCGNWSDMAIASRHRK